MKETIKDVIEVLKEDRVATTFMFKFLLILVVYLTGAGWITYHNFYLNTPEKFCDPINWIWIVVTICGYFFYRWWMEREGWIKKKVKK